METKKEEHLLRQYNQNNMLNPQMPVNTNPFQQQHQFPQMNYPNQQFIYQNPNMVYTQQPAFVPHKQKIMSLPGIFIKQKIDILEVVGGCEMQNKYFVYEKETGRIDRSSKKKLYKIKEKSECCSRNCVIPLCRELKLKVTNLGFDLQYDKESILVEKDCTCTFFCLSRPSADIFYTEEGGKEFLGKIYYPFDCCQFNYELKDDKENLLARFYTHCCQCGVLCQGCCFKACETVVFEVFDSEGNLYSTMTKSNKSCIKMVLSDADNFGFDFPENFDWKKRSLIMVSIIFIDYMMFEQR